MNFLDIFSKNNLISNFIKMSPAGAKLFHADGQTDMTKLIVAFPSFVNTPIVTVIIAHYFLLKFSKTTILKRLPTGRQANGLTERWKIWNTLSLQKWTRQEICNFSPQPLFIYYRWRLQWRMGFSPKKNNCLVFVMETACVLREVRNKVL